MAGTFSPVGTQFVLFSNEFLVNSLIVGFDALVRQHGQPLHEAAGSPIDGNGCLHARRPHNLW